LLTKSLNKEVKEVLPGMLRVESSARYYTKNEDGDCTLLYPFQGDEEDIENGHRYSHYRINGKLYDSIGVGKIDYWLKQKVESLQMTLF